MASSVKRELSLADEYLSPGKKPRLSYGTHSLIGSPLPPIASHRVVLNPADCDLDFNIEENGLKGSALYEHAFAYCWSGARATVGITGGKYCFSCKIISGQPVDLDDTPLDQKHLCRVGISTQNDNIKNLGETNHSFGFEGSGTFSNSGNFSAYGEQFNAGDTILCAVDFESQPMGSISFAKNGKWLGIARDLNGVNSAVFPHVLLKNVVVQMQFSYEDGLVPLDGFRPWGSAYSDGKGLIGPLFSDVSNCELIMMVGLPASGKTTWAERWVNDHPEKRYVLLGLNLALDQMKVPGLLRNQKYNEQFDRLMERATAIYNTLLTRASKTPRNFIIDQTNVYKSARKRKLKPFASYHKIAVVAFPRPEDLKFRSEKRFTEMEKEVPAEAANEMLANFVLPKSKDMPGTDEYFDQVIYIELNVTESQRCLEEMKANLQSGISSNPVRHSQEIMMHPHGSLMHQYPPESSSHFSHSTVSQYAQGNSLPTYQATPLSGHSQGSIHGNDPNNGRFLPRDDFNHRRSYSGYEHRAAAPMRGISVFSYQKNSSEYHNTPTNETMDLSPRYTATSSSTQSKYLSPTSIPHGSAYGTLDPMNTYGNCTMHAPNYDRYHSRSRDY